MECAGLNPVFSLCGNKRNNPTAPKITDNSTTTAQKSYPDYLEFYCWFGFSALGAGSRSVKHPPLGQGGGGIQQSWDKEKGAEFLGKPVKSVGCWQRFFTARIMDVEWRGYRTASSCTGLDCTALHCTVLDWTALHFTALHCTALHCTALHCTALHCTARYCNGQYSIAWQRISRYCKSCTLLCFKCVNASVCCRTRLLNCTRLHCMVLN